MSIKPGIRLGDRYQLLAPIATGGMGQVWRAEDTTLHRVVAAKILRSEFTGDETFLERFRAEARNTASLSHPNIASVYDYGEQVHDAERLCYLVMELVEGKPLVDILARERRLSPARTLDYLEQTAMGLAAAHRENMVHRDIKPGNLIIRPDGVLKITDFGIARAANSVALTERGTVVGTAQYLAPEQAEGKPAWPASDIYALGVVGYECLAGFRPFDGDNSVAIALAQIRETPRPLPADVPPHIRALIEMTMRKNPNARYEDGATFIPVVRAVRAGNMPPPPVIRGPQPPPPGAPGSPGPGAPPPARVPGQPAAPPSGARPPNGRPGFPTAAPGPAPRSAQGPLPGVVPQPPRAPVAGQQSPAHHPPAAQAPTPPLQAPRLAPTPQTPASHVQAPQVQAQPPHAQGSAPSSQTQATSSQTQAPQIQTQPPQIQPQTPQVRGGTGSFAQAPESRSGSAPATAPGHLAGTGSYPTGAGRALPGTGPEAPSRSATWFWIGLGLLLVAAIVALVVVLINDNGDTEMSGSPLMTITHTELKENMR